LSSLSPAKVAGVLSVGIDPGHILFVVTFTIQSRLFFSI
jgi:hypothetical protein